MKAPKSRYRVEEKDGRLTVIDTATESPASPVTPSPRPGSAPPTGSGAASDPIGLADRYGRLLLALVAKRRDERGRPIIAWEWEEDGRKRRWDAALGPAQQKRMGRGLAALSLFPLLVLVLIFAGFGLAFFLLPIVLGMAFWGVLQVMRVQKETGGGEAP